MSCACTCFGSIAVRHAGVCSRASHAQPVPREAWLGGHLCLQTGGDAGSARSVLAAVLLAAHLGCAQPATARTAFQGFGRMPAEAERVAPAVQRHDSARVRAATRLLDEAWEARAGQEYDKALLLYGEAAAYSDLALSARARLGRALLLYQAGASKQAIVELEGERLLTRASPEVDAALAAMLYVEQPDQRTLAESLWDSALQLDTRLSSLDFVSKARRWPPRLVRALDRFLLLS